MSDGVGVQPARQRITGGRTRAQRGHPCSSDNGSVPTNALSSRTARSRSAGSMSETINFARRSIAKEPSASTLPQVRYRNRSPLLPCTAGPRGDADAARWEVDVRGVIDDDGVDLRTRPTGFLPTWTHRSLAAPPPDRFGADTLTTGPNASPFIVQASTQCPTQAFGGGRPGTRASSPVREVHIGPDARVVRRRSVPIALDQTSSSVVP
jgi:hypothetical protein